MEKYSVTCQAPGPARKSWTSLLRVTRRWSLRNCHLVPSGNCPQGHEIALFEPVFLLGQMLHECDSWNMYEMADTPCRLIKDVTGWEHSPYLVIIRTAMNAGMSYINERHKAAQLFPCHSVFLSLLSLWGGNESFYALFAVEFQSSVRDESAASKLLRFILPSCPLSVQEARCRFRMRWVCYLSQLINGFIPGILFLMNCIFYMHFFILTILFFVQLIKICALPNATSSQGLKEFEKSSLIPVSLANSSVEAALSSTVFNL